MRRSRTSKLLLFKDDVDVWLTAVAVNVKYYYTHYKRAPLE
jgi:hypothetical protein